MRAIILATALAMVGSAALAETRPIVVELFTSQGCSSCPPADALLGELAGNPNLIALAFHVDYWDRLGWKDPLSAPGATQRQHEYARLFGNNEIYTPQMVVDGAREMVGSDRGQVTAAVSAAKADAAAPVRFSDDRRSVEIGAGAGRGRILVVEFAIRRTTAIARGENAGRTATDLHGVTAIADRGEWAGAAQRIAIDPPAANAGLAVLVQSADGHFIAAGSVLGSDRPGLLQSRS